MLHRIHMKSPFGTLCIEDDGEALTALYLDDWDGEPDEQEGESDNVNGETGDINENPENPDGTGGRPEDEGESAAGSELLFRAVEELQEYFAGERMSFDLPLRPAGTEFQKLVWNALREIPYGETRSYAEIAQAIGRPKACRAVGGANNKNPIMLFIPCHRVIGSDGSLTGFAGGLEMKRSLLEMEAANCGASERTETADCADFGQMEEPDYADSRQTEESEYTDYRQMEEPDCVFSSKGKPECLDLSGGKEKKDFEAFGKGEGMNREESGIGETQPSYVPDPGKTASMEDYYELPDDHRAELIDGVFYDMAAPSLAHQGAAAELYGRLRDYIVSQKGNCYPLMSPFDVQLDCDDRTMVQPDVAVVCDRNKLDNRCVFGAPDLVIEILSDSSVKRDCVLKLSKYMEAGVREYWIADLESKRVLVYESGREVRLSVYGMDERIPVGIFNGNCEIDFSEIYQWIRFLL